MTDNDFAQRIMQMQETLYRVSYSLLPQIADREDAVQESIRRAWQQRGKLRDDRYAETWLVRILLNVCYAMLKKKKREVPIEEMPERTAPPDADPFFHDMFLSLEEALRTPAVLYYVEEYPIGEIARMMRLPAGTVKSRLHRARKKIREAYSHILPGTKEVRR